MKQGRWAWAAAMCAAAVMVLAGYTEAGALRAAEAPPLPREAAPPPEEIAVQAENAAPAEETAWTPPEDALWLTIRDEAGQNGPIQIQDGQDRTLCTAEVDERGAYALRLSPGRYTLTTADGRSTAFTLRENAAITEVSGHAWSDGELLYLDETPRVFLRLLRTAETAVVYTLTGPECEESRALGGEAAETIFAGLLPGEYLLRGSDGSQRSLYLTEQQPELVLGLD